jgi:hypothetical protein
MNAKKQKELNKLYDLIPYSDYFEKKNRLTIRFKKLSKQWKKLNKRQTKVKNKIELIIKKMPF